MPEIGPKSAPIWKRGAFLLAPDLPEIGPDLPQSISSSSLSRFSRFARNSPQLAPIRPNWPESGYASHRGHIPSQIGPEFARNSPEIRPNPRLPIRANWPGFAPIRPNRPKSVGGARSQGGLVAFCGGATRPRMAKLFWRARTAPAPSYVAPPGCVREVIKSASVYFVRTPSPVVAFPGISWDL